MIGVVGDVEADARDGQPERQRENARLPPRGGEEHQQRPRDGCPGKDHAGLDVQPPPGTPLTVWVRDVLLDQGFQLDVERAAAVEADRVSAHAERLVARSLLNARMVAP